MNQRGPLWLGYSRLGGRFALGLDELRKGMAVLGHGANDLVAVMALACEEAGARVLVVDIDGTVSDRLSGYIDEYAAPHFLYDAMRLDEGASVHAQIAASAYACTLELSFEQEASLNALMQIIANEQGIASPVSLADLIQDPETARARTIDKLRLRLEALRCLNMVGEPGVLKEILGKSAILNFRGIGSPEASETAAALLLAKLIASVHEGGTRVPDMVVLTEANRLFKARPVFRKSQRFLTSFVSAQVAKVFCSDMAYGLDEDFLETCPVRMLSSAAWNEGGRGLLLTPNMFMLQNRPFGYEEAFIPRSIEARKGERKEGRPVTEASDEDKLALRVLEEIGAYGTVTRFSLVAFLSSEFPRGELEKAFDRLQSEGFVTVTPRPARSGRTMHALSLTEKGKARLAVGGGR